MTQYKFKQVDWKSFLIVIVPVLLFREMQNNWGTGIAMLIATGIGIILTLITVKFFVRVAEFRDSYLFLKKGYLGKAEKIPYAEFQQLTYSNATRFVKLTLVTAGNTMELPLPARLAQAEELFAWLRTKNPATEFEIVKPNPVLELN